MRELSREGAPHNPASDVLDLRVQLPAEADAPSTNLRKPRVPSRDRASLSRQALVTTVDRDRLFVLGNGVVPQAATEAFVILWRWLHGVAS